MWQNGNVFMDFYDYKNMNNAVIYQHVTPPVPTLKLLYALFRDLECLVIENLYNVRDFYEVINLYRTSFRH